MRFNQLIVRANINPYLRISRFFSVAPPHKPLQIPTTIKAVGFALNYTLIDLPKTIDAILAKTLDDSKLIIPSGKTLTKDMMEQCRNEAGRGIMYPLEFSLSMFKLAIKKLGINNESTARKMYQYYSKNRKKIVFPYNDSLIITYALRNAGYKIGIISNGVNYLRDWGLAKEFDFSIFPDEFRNGWNYQDPAKPDSSFYAAACEKADCAPHEMLFISHCLTDIMGANNFGMPTVWLNREKRVNHSNIQPLYAIDNLCKLEFKKDFFTLPTKKNR